MFYTVSKLHVNTSCNLSIQTSKIYGQLFKYYFLQSQCSFENQPLSSTINCRQVLQNVWAFFLMRSACDIHFQEFFFQSIRMNYFYMKV